MFELLNLAVFASFQATSPPATEPREDYMISTIWTRPDKCNVARAAKVDLQAVVKNPQKWTGKCVAVTGYWQHRALFANARDARTR
jgi:hypothetical protein